MEGLTDADWVLFFGLIERIVDTPPQRWQDKMAEVERQAERFAAGTALGEFCSWDWFSGDEPRMPF